MTKLQKMFTVLPLSLALLASTMAGVASAQTYPALSVQLLTQGLTQNAGAGTQNAIMAIARLDTTSSNEDIRISSLPLILTTGGGANGSSLQSCHLANANNISSPLSTSGNVPSALNSGVNTLALDTPLVLPRGSVTMLDLICNVSTTAAAGGSFTFSINTANVMATGVTSGLPAQVSITPGAVVIPPTTYPGVPNTGAGGEAGSNIALIVGSLLVASFGYLYSRRYARAR
jgi:hypothetical protein